MCAPLAVLWRDIHIYIYMINHYIVYHQLLMNLDASCVVYHYIGRHEQQKDILIYIVVIYHIYRYNHCCIYMDAFFLCLYAPMLSIYSILIWMLLSCIVMY